MLNKSPAVEDVIVAVPVDVEHVGCVIAKVGAFGAAGTLLIVKLVKVEMQLLSALLLAAIVWLPELS
jgi:hypothetical protein